MKDKLTGNQNWRKILRYSTSFSRASKESPKEVSSESHELLTRAGYIRQEMAGVFSLLPLGVKVLKNIETVIRDEMDSIGGQEVLMPALEPKQNWVTTGRWDTVDILFKVNSRYGNREYVLGPTHEEIVTPLVKSRVKSYKDLPLAVYQIQTKFRDELRAKSGIIRGREFGMKDMYSFHVSHESLVTFYEQAKEAYLRVFSRCGITAKVTEASGGDFTKKISHEFMALSDAGEDTIIYCDSCAFAQNTGISKHKDADACPSCSHNLRIGKAIEIGNIFDLGTKFSEAFDFTFTDKDSTRKLVYMGCYGIGTTRLIGAIVEAHNDGEGIIWPYEVAPYSCHLVGLNLEESEIKERAEEVLQEIVKSGLSVLFDDRPNVGAGDKFAVADLIGIPIRITIGRKTFTEGEVEIKRREDSAVIKVTISELSRRLVTIIENESE
ncbi:MAG: hypothetical protein KKC54_02435 [Nanoarchaeota archaeon]|nr:hypothetical protein [Nanoarchaeota archaeon]